MMGPRALVLLGWHFLQHVLRKLTFRYDAGGSKRFLSNYHADGLLPVGADDRDRLASYQSCIACGLCDAQCTADGTASTLVAVAAGVRDLSAVAAASLDVAGLGCAGCDGCATVCPVGVPINDALRFVSAQGAAMKALP